VSNNIVYGNAGWGIQEQGASASSTGLNNVYTHNLVNDNSSGGISLQNALTAVGTVLGSPLFVNYTGTSTGNYQLQSDSPAIKAGTSSGAPTYDFNNASRPQGANDIGAYQYASTTADANSAAVSLNPATLSFPDTTVGSSSAVKYATLSNASSSTLSFNGLFTISGPFAFGGLGTCSSSVTVGGSCTISVVFKPTQVGAQTGTVTVNDSAGTQTLKLSGTAVN
jgi:hypothetical protein